jgi:hypothetical protein
MELFIQKFLDVFHIAKMDYDVCQDLYAELIFEIYLGKIKFFFAPSEFMIIKKLKPRLSNYHRDNDHRNKKLMQQALLDV